MQYTLTSPDGISAPVTITSVADQQFFDKYVANGWKLEKKLTIHRKPMEECEACSA